MNYTFTSSITILHNNSLYICLLHNNKLYIYLLHNNKLYIYLLHNNKLYIYLLHNNSICENNAHICLSIHLCYIYRHISFVVVSELPLKKDKTKMFIHCMLSHIYKTF